jgi:hypothetical protein
MVKLKRHLYSARVRRQSLLDGRAHGIHVALVLDG